MQFQQGQGKIDPNQGKHGHHIRLQLRTDDLARIFRVKPDTIRSWISKGKLALTGDPVKDFDILVDLYLA